MVVGVEPAVKGGAPFGFEAVGAGVGPFLQEGAVESLHFPVGLGPVGADALVGDAAGGKGVAPGEGLAAGAVVSHHLLHGDPGGGEPGAGARPEGGGGFLALISADLAVGQAGVVVDGGVQVAVADHRLVVAPRPGGGPGVALAPG